MKTKLLFLLLLLTLSLQAQYTSIPDVNFEKKLIALGVDSGVVDGKVLTANISSLRVLELQESSISDLTGIQDFVGLQNLICRDNKITSIDITKLTSLTSLTLYNNKLTTLDVSKNTKLNWLDVQLNELVSLDVSNNIALQTFRCGFNKLTSIDISKNVLLKDFYCSLNPIASLDVTNNIKLESLGCSNGLLTVLDLTKNTALITFDCSGSDIRSLDLSNCTKLKEFKCNDVYNLTTLNLKNGNNRSMTVFNIKSNYAIKCIQVDDPSYSDVYWLSLKEATAKFSTNCYGYTAIPDPNFEEKLINLGIDNDGKNGKVLTFDISRVSSLSIGSSNISDLTGIEDFTTLISLYADSNQLTNINLSKNNKLLKVDLSSNKLTTLDITNNTALTDLKVDSNQLTAINTSRNSALTNFSSANNPITQLDFSSNSSLKSLNCSNTSLASLNLKNGNNRILTTLDLKSNPSLNCILVDDKTYSDANWADKKDIGATYNHSTCEIYTLIPDPKFEAKLIALGIDSGTIDGKVLTANISTVTTLDVSSSSIKNLSGIENFTSLKELICFENEITSLNLSQNYELTYLDCDKNSLTALNLSKNILLADLICSNNNLSTIDVTKNINLLRLNCASNNLLNIDVSKNTKLVSFNFNGNQLKTLDISKNIVLTDLDCGGNQFGALDFSKTTTLINLNCNRNNLEYLNLKNGKNNILIEPDFKNNPKLTCILVDNASYSDENWANSKEDIASFNDVSCSILIPDGYFEDKLIQLGIDKDGKNGSIAISSVLDVTSLDIRSSLISDLTGIQSFKNLKVLDCGSNRLTTIDLSKNTELTDLSLPMNKLTNLDLSKNTALTKLTCYSNLLTNLDLSANTALDNVSCDRNQMTSLNTSKNKILTYLDCSQNQLPNLDVSQNTALLYLNCSTNKITNLDVSKNTVLASLTCKYNKIEILDVSHNLLLKEFVCSNNLLKRVDISKNTALTVVECSYNNLEYANAKNGNNKKLRRAYFGINPNLFCILVDDAAYSYANYTTWFKETAATFSDTVCDVEFTLIPDPKFEDILIEYEIDTDGKNGKVMNKSIESIQTLHIFSSSISDLTGIEGFKNLESLNCSDNNLKTLDVSKNLLLVALNCEKNQLTNLDVSKNPLLIEVICGKNKITELDFSSNKELSYLRCDSNLLRSLDISTNKEMGTLDCNSNLLESLNLKNGNNTGLYDVNFTSNPNLTCILVDNALFSSYYWKEYKDNTATFSETSCEPAYIAIPDPKFEQKLVELKIDTDGVNGKISTVDIKTITSLDLSKSDIKDLTGIKYFTSLTYLDVSNNQLTYLDLSNNIALETLNASSNQLTSLDLSKNSKLIAVYVVGNPLEFLNLQNGNNKNMILAKPTSKNTALTVETTFLGLKELTCIKVDNAAYSIANWSQIKENTTTYSETCKSLGLEESAFDKAVLYPNPTNGKVNINNVSLEKANVYNTLGQLVKSFTLVPGSSDHTIDLANLPKGVYYIYLINRDKASAKKIIVE